MGGWWNWWRWYEVRFIFQCETALVAGDLIELPWQREGAMLTVRWRGEEPVTRFAGRKGPTITLDLTEYLAGSGSVLAGAKRYTVLGVEHILEGIDHLLFLPWRTALHSALRRSDT